MVTRRQHLFVLACIVLLAIGTFVALTLVVRDQHHHETLDAHACALSHANRTLIHDTLGALIADPGERNPATQAQLAELSKRAKALENEVCST